MMYQGLFGAFPFTVSEAEVCTFRDLKTSRKFAYAEHKALDGLARLQHTGRELDSVSMTVIIAPLAGISTVGVRLAALAMLTGKELPLVIGLKYYGLQVLESYEVTRRQVHFGTCLFAEVAMNFREYN